MPSAVIGLDDTTVTLPFTRGSTMKFLPVTSLTVAISVAMSASFRFSVTSAHAGAAKSRAQAQAAASRRERKAISVHLDVDDLGLPAALDDQVQLLDVFELGQHLQCFGGVVQLYAIDLGHQ